MNIFWELALAEVLGDQGKLNPRFNGTVFRPSTKVPGTGGFLDLSNRVLRGPIENRRMRHGSVTGVLLTGLVIGQADIPISPAIKAIFFLFFLFAVGYGVGPQFFHGLKKEGIKHALFAALVSLACLVTAFLTARILRLGVGYGGGVFGAHSAPMITITRSDSYTRE